MSNKEEKGRTELLKRHREEACARIPVPGMKDSEYKACMDGLGLLEGEEIRLQYVCHLCSVRKGAFLHAYNSPPKGLLVFSNDNLIFMQKEGFFGSKYGQRLRIPIENISGVLCAVGFDVSIFGALRIVVGTAGQTEEYNLVKFKSKKKDEVRKEIQEFLTEARQEKKRLAQEALAGGTIPSMIFCKYCGGRNKADQTKCANCGAVLT